MTKPSDSSDSLEVARASNIGSPASRRASTTSAAGGGPSKMHAVRQQMSFNACDRLLTKYGYRWLNKVTNRIIFSGY